MKRRRRSTYTIYARRNWFYRNKVLVIVISAFIVLAIAAAIFTASFISKKKKEAQTIQYEAMTTATLPTISFTYKGRQINLTRGYTEEMDYHYSRRSIFVLEDGYDIPVNIELYGNEITSLDFRIIDTQSERDNLIQKGQITEFNKSEDLSSCDITVDNIIEDGREYILEMILKDAKERNIYYYTRIKKDSETTLDRQIQMALRYNDSMYNANIDENKQFILRHLSTSYWHNDNTDFSDMTLYSSITAITWGKMKVKKVAEPEVEVLDEDGEIGYFMLNYIVTRMNGEDEEYYRVNEYMRIRLTDEYAYVLDYDRISNQVFNPKAEGTIGTKSAKLGIIKDKNIEMLCNPSGSLSCFVADNTLWAMETATKTLNKIFTFSSDTFDTRGNYDQHDIRLINVTDEGNIRFIVYGYMNAGLHEGKVGIGMYTFHADTRKVEEEVFIPTNLTYEILKNSVGDLFYLNSDNELYMMIDQYLYKIDINSDKVTMVTDGLIDGTYVIHSEGRYIAWHEGSKVNDATVIKVLNLENGSEYQVSANRGSCIKALGFLNTELAYGEGAAGDIYEELSGAQHLLMTKMYVVNDKAEIQTESDSGDSFFIGAENEYNRVIINKVRFNGTSYEPTEDYTLFATDLEAYPSLESYSEYEEVKRTVYYVVFADSTTSAGELTINRKAVAMFTDEKTINLTDMLDDSGRYYVYAKGEVKGIENEPAKAIMHAYDECGVALRADGSLFYKRGLLPSSVELSSTGLENAYKNIKAGNMTNVTGITLTEAMYYTGNKIPIAWEWDGSTYVFFGYDSHGNVTMFDVDTKEKVVLTSEYLGDIIKTAGHVYVVEENGEKK